MKIYCNKIELSKPAPIQIWVSKNSDYGIGLWLYKSKTQPKLSFSLYDGNTFISPSGDTIDNNYTVFKLKSANKPESKVLSVTYNGREVATVTVNTTDSSCAEVAPQGGLDAEGVKTMLSDGSVNNIQLTEESSVLFVNGSIAGINGSVYGDWSANNLVANVTLFLDNDSVIIFGSPFDDQNRVTLTKEDVVKLKALIANS